MVTLLKGVLRKLSLLVLLLSLAGFITYAVGFALRNFSFNERTDEFTAATVPEYFFFWLLLGSGLLFYVLSMLQSCLTSRIPAFLAFLFAPAFLLSLGAVLFVDGLSIYAFYRETDGNGAPSNSSVNLRCMDLRFNETVSEINEGDLYIPLEFAGALSAVVFYWFFMMMIPFFSPEESNFFKY